MTQGPTTWGGWVKAASAMTDAEAVSGGYPELLHEDFPAYCISVDDLPGSGGGAPVSVGLDTTHEWNVARFRRITICDADTGEQLEAYVLMTAPTAVGSLG